MYVHETNTHRYHQTCTTVLHCRPGYRSSTLPLHVILRRRTLRTLPLGIFRRRKDHRKDVEVNRLVLHLLCPVNTAGNDLACNQTEMVLVSVSCEQPSLGVAMGYRTQPGHHRARKCLDVPFDTLRRQSRVQLRVRSAR